MAPRPREGWQPGRIPPDCRDGAGLLGLFPGAAGTTLLLTVRDHQLLQHPGQVSLPGGALDRGETIVAAALREAREEIGLRPEAVKVVGELSPLHIPVSRFVLHPVVAIGDEIPPLTPQPGEVARILEVSLARLQEPTVVRVERREFKGNFYDVPYFAVDGEKVWGATAMILAELLELLGTPPMPFPHDRP